MKKILWFVLAAMLFCATAGGQTEKVSDEAVEKDLFETGVLQFKQGEYQQAVDTFTDLIKLFPQNADAFKNRGVAHMKLEKFDDAIADFESAKKISPTLKGVYSNLGVIWYYRENYEKAIENYNSEIEITPDNAVAYFNRALCMTKLGETENAISDLTAAISISPDFYWAICYKADLLAHTGRVEEAIALYETAIEKDRENTYAIEKLARLQDTATDAAGEGALAASAQGADQLEASRHAGDENTEAGSDTPLYTLQAGAFLNQENAQHLKEKLIENGFDAKILVLTDKKQRSWYLVRSNQYSSQDDARKDTAAIQNLTGTAPVIRPEGAW
ncbi:MAG: tetratricopeptide repeat protein [Desulfotignum sp.]|nr:tetratricopeptide repeat protein [Desulfotignum sp.]